MVIYGTLNNGNIFFHSQYFIFQLFKPETFKKLLLLLFDFILFDFISPCK